LTTGLYDQGDPLRAVLTADGRALLAWTTADSLDEGVAQPRLARGSLTEGFGAPIRLGSPVRDANVAVPLFVADGREAVTWADNGGRYGERDGRVHVAVEGAPARRSPPPPRLTLRSARTQRLFAAQPLRVTVGCDRACDVRASAASHDEVAATRLRRGRIDLELSPATLSSRRADERVRVKVRATAPNGRRVASATELVRISRRPPLPVPRPLDVRARHRGGAIVVAWRTATPARRTYFVVQPLNVHRRDLGTLETVKGRGRSRFRVRVTLPRPEGIPRIVVAARSIDGGPHPGPVLVRVR
jgi:hypothetical protein